MSRRIKNPLTALILAVVVLSCGCSGPNPEEATGLEGRNPAPTGSVVQKGNRILELDANTPENDDYDQSMALARQLGAESIRMSVYWDEIEISPGVFNPDPNWLAIANVYYSAQDIPISLVISVLDTTEVRLPSDLEGRSFDDPILLERFQSLLDYVNEQLSAVRLTSLAIGNEIDGVLKDDRESWEAFQAFYEPAAAYARELWPDLPISTKVTFDGLTGPNAELGRDIFQNSPVVMTTYYPLRGDFTVKDPEVILDDFATLAEIFPDKEIHITEIGYPTSQVNGSSEEKQARFIRAAFQAWDVHADQFTVLSFSWLSDLPESTVREMTDYYGIANLEFGEFLRTLGLRTYPGDGENKAGFEAFQEEATARGW